MRYPERDIREVLLHLFILVYSCEGFFKGKRIVKIGKGFFCSSIVPRNWYIKVLTSCKPMVSGFSNPISSGKDLPELERVRVYSLAPFSFARAMVKRASSSEVNPYFIALVAISFTTRPRGITVSV